MNLLPINRDICIDGFHSGCSKDYASDIRDLKLKLISGDFEFTISDDMVYKYKNQLEFISDKFSEYVITGSLVLNLFNLINRDIKDIDIIIPKDKSNDYSYRIGSRYGMREVESSNRLGYVDFRYKRTTGFFDFFKRKKKYTVDFFKDDDPSYIEFDFKGTKLKLQTPIDIILQKVKMKGSTKHSNDITHFFNSVELNSK